MEEFTVQKMGNVSVTIVYVNAVTESVLRDRFGEDSPANRIPLRIASGKFFNGAFSEKLPFRGFHDLLMKMDTIFDYFSFPQRSTEMRSFAEQDLTARLAWMKESVLPELTQKWGERVVHRGRGDCATFMIHVYARQNCSWQGKIHWLEGNREGCFRSLLELMYFMESVLDKGRIKAADESAEMCDECAE